MKITKTILYNLTFIFSAILLVLLSVFSYNQVNQQAAASDWVAHSYLVKLKLDNAFARLRKAESSQRGYLLTKDTGFITQLNDAIGLLPARLAEIDSLVADNPTQVRNLKTAEGLFQRRRYFIRMVLDSGNTLSAASLDHNLRTGKIIMDSLARQINLMNQSEDSLLASRIAQKAKEKERSATFILVFSIISVSVLLLSYLRIKAESKLLDVSEINKKALEEKVSERTAELKRANEMLSRQNLELEQKNKELNSFTFVASHDLKEPLRKISIFSSRVIETEEPNLSPQGSDYLNKIAENSSRMQNLIDSILTYARAEKEMAFTQTDLAEIAKNAITTLQETIDEKEATVEYANLPAIAAIHEQMEQLFINLISNSLKYSKAGVKPHIRINAEKQTQTGATFWKISFADNGIGFDEAYKEKIFQIFQRLHTKDQYSGTGIGLAICKKIMDNHNGSISATSVPNEGAVFTVILPAVHS